MWPETLPAGCFAKQAKIPLKFSTLSSSMSIPPHLVTFPTSSPSTAPNYPVNFHRPQLRERACRRVAGTNRIISNYLISCNRPSAWLSPLAIFFLWLSGAISPPGSPVYPLSATEPPIFCSYISETSLHLAACCLSPVCN